MQGQIQSSTSSTVHTSSPPPLRQAAGMAPHLRLILEELDTMAPQVAKLDAVQDALLFLYHTNPDVFATENKPITWSGPTNEAPTYVDRDRMVHYFAEIQASKNLQPLVDKAFRAIFNLKTKERMDHEKLLFSQSAEIDSPALHFLRAMSRMMVVTQFTI